MDPSGETNNSDVVLLHRLLQSYTVMFRMFLKIDVRLREVRLRGLGRGRGEDVSACFVAHYGILNIGEVP